ncbi:hypothetical protein CFOL_v3_21404, partial [Cephalotus follicularis]
TVDRSSPQCHCSVLNDGLNINQTLALSLPGASNVLTPSTSQCNGKLNLSLSLCLPCLK